MSTEDCGIWEVLLQNLGSEAAENQLLLYFKLFILGAARALAIPLVARELYHTFSVRQKFYCLQNMLCTSSDGTHATSEGASCLYQVGGPRMSCTLLTIHPLCLSLLLTGSATVQNNTKVSGHD